jgi:uncharacterized membrane protein YhaH (DUF805 family)
MFKLYLSPRGRITRLTFWAGIIFLLLLFAVLFAGLETLIGRSSTWILYPPFFWALFVVCAKRYHDLNRSATWLLLLLIPLLGVVWVGFELACRRGSAGENTYGADPLTPNIDYLVVR